MTDKNNFADEAREYATADDDSPHTQRAARWATPAWDFAHFWAERVVSRSYAEFCAVLDLLVGAVVLFVLFVR